MRPSVKLLSIEPTPNPNSMKLNLDEALPPGVTTTYRVIGKAHYPEWVQALLSIPGVESIYHCLDFMAVQRNPSTDWEGLLSEARRILSGEAHHDAAVEKLDEPWGEVQVSVQNFRRIPMLVKVSFSGEESRIALPKRFGDAVAQATPSSPNMLLERKWVPQKPRYGERQEVGEQVAQEIDATYDQVRLDQLVRQAFDYHPEENETRRAYTDEERAAMLASGDWKARYAALTSMDSGARHFDILLGLMSDPNASVRRLATVYMGLSKKPESLPLLVAAMKDPAVAVRRSAGDALNDLGDQALADGRVAPAMAEALKDANKLVRWRAARFLFELGDTRSLPALKAAEEDPEFEVRMQIRQAIERIEGGKAALGPIWMQMTSSQSVGRGTREAR
jgi:hypothetical protein